MTSQHSRARLQTTWDRLDDVQKQTASTVTRVIVQRQIGVVDLLDLEIALLIAEQDPDVRDHIEVVVDTLYGEVPDGWGQKSP